MRFVRHLCVSTVVVGAILVFASSAFASTDSSSMALRGQCGGQIHSWQQYMNNLAVFGAVAQAANVNRSAGYSPRDGSFRQWLKERVVYTRLAAPVTITNYGCNANGLFGAGKKHLTKGWPVLVTLPVKFSKSDVRMAPKRGYKAIIFRVHLVAQASCTNPGKAIVKVVIYVKVKAKPKKHPKKPVVKPTTPTGNCNVINSPGGMACSNPVYVNVCGTQVVYNGDQDHLQQWINSYVADHCAPTVTTTTCNVAGAINYGKAGDCVMPPTCQFGGTFPNCNAPPCSVTNTCPPSQFSVSGSTSVSSTKTAACPPPNSSIVKTGTAALTSPTFTGTGSTQAAAQADLDQKLATWRSQNQGAVDAQAQANANAQLASCPVPVTPHVQVTCTGPEEISGNGSIIIKCDVSNNTGGSISLDAHSNDANSYVSGINCYSQGGSPSCQGGSGQFEFRVNGVNNGSTVLMTSVTVTATTNGANDSHTYTFKVDPAGGGF